MNLKDDTKAIVASSLTVAYSFLYQSKYAYGKDDREQI